ncbi:MAG: recombinase family protein [Dysgonomonas sp.]
MEAAALIRVSTSQQELDSQIYDLRIKAKSLGYKIPDNLIFGQKITGFDGGYIRDKKTGEVIRKEDRDSITELKQACEKDKDNRIRAIFIWEISRLSRKSSTLGDYIEWFNTAEKPIYFTSHNLWTINPETNTVDDNDIFMIKMLATFAEQERSKIMERYQRGKTYAITEQDRYVGGSIPYGYDLQIIGKKKYYIIHEERSKIIQDIFDKYLYDGWASDKIARYLNLNNIPTYYNFNNPDKDLITNIGRRIKRSEIKWSHTAVLQILRNPFYKGVRTYKNLEIECTSIIDATVFDKVQELMKDNNKFGSKTRKFNYPIKSLLRCGICGSKFYGAVTSSKQLYYCNRFQLEGVKCDCNKINKYKLDGLIWSFISKTPYIYEYFKHLYSIDSDSEKIEQLNKQNDLENTAIIELKMSRKAVISRLGKPMYDDADLDEQALTITKQINEYQSSIKKRNAQINLLFKQQKYKATPEQIKKDIDNAGDDIDKITILINTLIRTITIYNLVEKRFTLISICLDLGNITNVNTNVSLVFDHSDRSNKFYYIGSSIYDNDKRKFNIIKPIIPSNIDTTDEGIVLEVMGSIEAIKANNQTYKEELVNNLKDKYNITLENEWLDIYGMISNGYAVSYTYDTIEDNPFTYSNPEYAAYKKKDNKRRNDLKKLRKQKKDSNYIKTPQEEYNTKMKTLYCTRTKIRNSTTLSEADKQLQLDNTRIEMDRLRLKYKGCKIINNNSSVNK